MKIPVVEDPANMYNNHDSSVGYLPPENSEVGHQDQGGTPPADDFSEYLWMENEEEFDKQILQQLEEEALMEHCLEVMLDHERDLDNAPYSLSSAGSDDTHPPTWNDPQQAQQNGADICHQMNNLRVQDPDELAKQSTLNPNAAEFVPQSRTLNTPLVEKTS